MPHNVVHFSIHAGAVERAREFYGRVFGWRFQAWGPPDFYLIQTGDGERPGIQGALQKRQHPVEGRGVIGFECTIAVDDLPAIARSVEEHGGRVVVPEMEIPTVGRLIQFADTEGNLACAMRYEDEHRARMG